MGQTSNDYTIIYIDDNSDLSQSQKRHIRAKLKGHRVVINQQRQFAVRNAYEAIHSFIDDDQAIVINLDGDDWLIRRDVVDLIQQVYAQTGCQLTYGNCVYHEPGSHRHECLATALDRHSNRRYPEVVENNNGYRRDCFRPLHLRTWQAGLFKQIHIRDLQRPDGTWLRYCEDQAIMLPMFEMAQGNYAVLSEPLSAYNRATNLNDDKLAFGERLFDEVCILRKEAYATV